MLQNCLCRTETLKPHHWAGDYFHVLMIRFDNIIKIFTLPYFNISFFLFVKIFNASGIGAALVDINFNRSTIARNGLSKAPQSSFSVSFGSQKEVYSLGKFQDIRSR